MESFLVTVNLGVYQIIEHLDEGGTSGNLMEVLSALLDGNGARWKELALLRNRVLPGFLVSPGEQGRFNAFLRRLFRHSAGGHVLGDWLGGLPGAG
jgi:hypothetical protein